MLALLVASLVCLVLFGGFGVGGCSGLMVTVGVAFGWWLYGCWLIRFGFVGGFWFEPVYRWFGVFCWGGSVVGIVLIVLNIAYTVVLYA